MKKQTIERICVLDAAGYSHSAIALKSGYTVRTIQNVLTKTGSTKRSALVEKSVELARQEMLADAGFIGEIKQHIARSIIDDLAIASALRGEIKHTLDEIKADKTPNYIAKSRSLAALSTALTVTQGVVRKALNVQENAPVNETSLEVLTIRKMTIEEVKEARSRSDALEVD